MILDTNKKRNRPTCPLTNCNNKGTLQLKLFGSLVDCPTGQTVDLARALPGKFEKGSVGPCPDNKAMCESLACGPACAVGGVCKEGKCHCNLQFTGEGPVFASLHWGYNPCGLHLLLSSNRWSPLTKTLQTD